MWPGPSQQNRLYYVHISAPDRGAVRDSWIPWDIMLGEIEPVYRGPYLIEVFNAIPPFDSSMRMSRRRFWRPGEDDPDPKRDSAYDVARAALEELQEQMLALAKGWPRQRCLAIASMRTGEPGRLTEIPAAQSRSHNNRRKASRRCPHSYLYFILCRRQYCKCYAHC